MLHSIEEINNKLDAMKDKLLILRLMVEREEDQKHCKHVLEQVQSMALEIANDKYSDEILVTAKRK